MGRKSVPIKIIVHAPKTEEGKRKLAQRVAGIHADIVYHTMNQLHCPVEQKKKLLNAVIEKSRAAL